MSGLMSVTGEPGGGPVRVGVAISDTSPGMFLGQGILLALLHREKTGEVQWVHTSPLEAMLCKLDFQGARYTMLGDVPEQQGNHHPTAVPMGTYTCKDGYVNIAAAGDRMWKDFCRAVQADDLLDDERYATNRGRRDNKTAIKADMERVLAEFGLEANRIDALKASRAVGN
jgi:crotonobetainyl-CoA:carnitine CoA-transferase CaiB-like acyl-CoA transferase